MNKTNLTKRIITFIVLTVILTTLGSGLLCLAAEEEGTNQSPGDIIVSLYEDTILSEAKKIINGVVFPITVVISAGITVAAIIITLQSYRKKEAINWTWPIVAVVSLIISLSSSSFFWDLVGA